MGNLSYWIRSFIHEKIFSVKADRKGCERNQAKKTIIPQLDLKVVHLERRKTTNK